MILYNGAWMKELDPVNLKGLIVPERVRDKAVRAINTPWEEPDSEKKDD